MKLKIFLTSLAALTMLTGCQKPISSSLTSTSSPVHSSLSKEESLIGKLHATRDRFESLHKNAEIYNARVNFDLTGSEYIYASKDVANIDTTKLLNKVDYQMDGDFIVNVDLVTSNIVKDHKDNQETSSFPDDDTEFRLDFTRVIDEMYQDTHTENDLKIYFNDNMLSLDVDSSKNNILTSDDDLHGYYEVYNGVYDDLIDCLSVNSIDEIYSYMKVMTTTVLEYVLDSFSNGVVETYSEIIRALIAFISSPGDSREEVKNLIISILATMMEMDILKANTKFGNSVDNILTALEKIDFNSFISSRITDQSIKIFINFGAVQRAIGILYNSIQQDLLDLIVTIQGNDNMSVEQVAQLRAAASILINQYLVLINSIISTFELSFTMNFTEDLLTGVDSSIKFFMPSEFHEENKEPLDSYTGYDFKINLTFDMEEGKVDIKPLIVSE